MRKTTLPVRPATKKDSVNELEKTYVNVSCYVSLKDAATVYANENGLDSPQDVFRVAATQFLKRSGHLKI